MTKQLGKGSYGSVISRDGFAIKKFQKLQHLVQEWAAASYLRDTKYSVKHFSFKTSELEITMELFDMSLRKLMTSGDDYDKRKVLHDIICALVEFQERGLVHGDIKPGNILIRVPKNTKKRGRKKPIKAVLGDLGFVSLAPFSKVERTASMYRDPVPKGTYGHDMYSLGIIILEMMGNAHIRKQYSYTKLHTIARDHLKGGTLDLVLRLTKKNHATRPYARDVLTELYSEKLSIDQVPSGPPDTEYKHDPVAKVMKAEALKHKIKRAKRGYKALKINKQCNLIHAVAMLLILSAMFGKSTFTESEALKIISKKELHLATTKLLRDDVIDILLVP